ncbi:MAG TPA: cysteine--tRNA ligase, partial [Saprospiraceae bacterium]|nr:cysteine--tRNA ligase [Saprospiraceae bacterium]
MSLKIYNSISGTKEPFLPIIEGRVGMYVCGPTVYNDVHIGNCRTFVSFDVIYRYLMYLGYKVRYVRNITDVGHLEGDVDSNAEDKISKKARLEQLEPMEIVQKYTNGFHEIMRRFNNLEPSIEPRATGHILEQIEMVEEIIKRGYAYEANGSVYFDTNRLLRETDVYGKLSGRKVEDLLVETRDLKNQDEKRHPSDFAIWIKADERHLLRWNAPWSNGFPGWHLECSVMSTKYLGERFDIHGGGNDLKFPHHENEIAQSYGACGNTPANYWIHSNMLLLNGKKMSKSEGNNITPVQIFTGDSPHISKAYSPMSLRFFFLQAHYSSTLDLNDASLSGAEKGYRRLVDTYNTLKGLTTSVAKSDSSLATEIHQGIRDAFDEMNDDFNAPKALARLFELCTVINKLADGQLKTDDAGQEALDALKKCFSDLLFVVFGLFDESAAGADDHMDQLQGLMQLVIEMRQQARENKDWPTSDKIRDTLNAIHIELKDGKEGTSWKI